MMIVLLATEISFFSLKQLMNLKKLKAIFLCVETNLRAGINYKLGLHYESNL